MFDYLALFLSGFFMTMLLGLQSKNVNQSRYWAAGITSVGILAAQIVFAKAAVHGGYPEYIILAIGSALGITSSIWIHDRAVKSKERMDELVRAFLNR